MSKLQAIPNWIEKKLVCDSCGTNKSVKYTWDKDLTLCNKCALMISLKA